MHWLLFFVFVRFRCFKKKTSIGKQASARTITRYAVWLGMDKDKDKDLFYLARDCMKAKCPPEWSRGQLSWKVRYRTFLWFFSQMSKLYRARSLLYRRQILQENIRWKALDEIYKIYMLLHRSDLNIFYVKLLRSSRQFFAKLVVFEYFSLNFAQILMNFLFFSQKWNFVGISPINYFRKYNNVEHSWIFLIF